MELKNRIDLEKEINDFNQFIKFISEFKFIVDTGKLAEFYCIKLFNLKPTNKKNDFYDATDSESKRIEIKFRDTFKKQSIPSGMEIKLETIDYVLLVYLDETLLPQKIYKIKSEYIDYTTGKRVSFKRAFNENKLLFSNNTYKFEHSIDQAFD